MADPTPRPDGTEGPARQQPLVIGTPVSLTEPRPPSVGPYRPDTVCDGWSLSGLTLRLASVRGHGHRHHGEPRQDDVAVRAHPHTNALAFAVADGVSAAEEAHVGAVLACRTAVDDIMSQLDTDAGDIDLRRAAHHAAWQLVMRVTGGAEPDDRARAEAERRLATTLITGVVLPAGDGSITASLVRVGDSGAWLLNRRRYTRLFPRRDVAVDEPDTAEVVALPRIPSALEPVRVTVPPQGVLLVGTDGFADALGDGTGAVGRIFGRELAAPVPAVALGYLLDFSWDTFDDDRSLLAVWPKDGER
ncbi:protein phosphatase 2C domain-containing protein [Streptomyces sp. NPDC053367]|uniref:protein phosphatase 2C domain-containing protein n=1 Tax=Streptomyces sp. NPDC053367 TaxID=3365700 RepID=UPI0037D985E4